ncbi:MAG TPA: PEP-CTERM sorting domain-containing protein [Cellvibrio sp.]
MHTIHRWAVRCLAFMSVALAVPASAYLQFTYTSPELPPTAVFIAGDPVNVDDFWLEPISFNVSFNVAEQDLSLKPITHFFMDDFSITFNSEYGPLYFPLRLSPASYGRVSLNRDGDITGWNLMLTITELITPQTDMIEYRLANYRVDITSQNGTGCNCDLFSNRFHPFTWHGGRYIQFQLYQFDYLGTNDAGSWTIREISVPEPQALPLLLVGLPGLIAWRRRRKY